MSRGENTFLVAWDSGDLLVRHSKYENVQRARQMFETKDIVS